MATRIPQNFRKGGQVTALYNFVDVMKGVGILTLYGATHQQVIASGGILTTSTVSSDDVQTRGDITQSGAPPAVVLDLDFDVTINIPITFSGIAAIDIPLTARSDEVEGHGVYSILHVYIKKVIDGAETILVSGASLSVQRAWVSSVERSYHESKVLVSLDIPTTVFKVGEILRLTTVALGYKSASASNPILSIGHDPQSRIPTNYEGAGPVGFISPENTQLILNMPVKIDI